MQKNPTTGRLVVALVRPRPERTLYARRSRHRGEAGDYLVQVERLGLHAEAVHDDGEAAN